MDMKDLLKFTADLDPSEVAFHHLLLKECFDEVRQRCISLANNIGKSYCENLSRLCWQDLIDPFEEYNPQALDVIEAMLEEVDNLLDRKRKKPQEVAPKQKKSRPEVNDSAALKPNDMQIFVAEIHPYAEILKDLSYPDWVMQAGEITPPSDFESTPCHWIDDPDQLQHLADTLAVENIFGIDLEHHSLHSYHGLVCLMQISTRSADYLIDTIKLRKEVGPALRSVLADPRHLKVFHGAESDILWLQRDFGLWVVGMFDTYFACRSLGLARHSLSHLLQEYVGIEVDKQYQMADWRQRPLPEEMLKYARQDTHYLPYLFDRLQKDLIAAGHLSSVLKSSAARCSLLYRPAEAQDWRRIIRSSTAPLSPRETTMLKTLYAWRDQVARLEDISPPAVLSDGDLIRMAQGAALDRLRSDTCIAQKHISLLNLEEKPAVKKPEVKERLVGVHTRFDVEEEKPELKTRRPIGFKQTVETKSLASMFVQQAETRSDVTSIIAEMPIKKTMESAVLKLVEPEKLEVQVKEVKEYKAEIKLEVEMASDRMIQLAKRKRKTVDVTPFDYEAAIAKRKADPAVDESPFQVEEVVTEEEVAETKSAPVVKQAKLSNQPRSGNKSATFKISK